MTVGRGCRGLARLRPSRAHRPPVLKVRIRAEGVEERDQLLNPVGDLSPGVENTCPPRRWAGELC